MPLRKSYFHSQLFYLLLLLAVGTLPFTIYLILPIALLMMINWFAEWNWKEKICCLKQNPGKYFFILFISLYLIYIIGLIYTDNFPNAFSILESKSLLLAAPLLIFTAHPEVLTSKRINTIFLVFLFSCTLLAITNIVMASFDYANDGKVRNFFYVELSRFMHPSYSSMFMNLSVVFSLYFLFINPVKLKRNLKILLWISIPILIVYIFLLQSKAGLLVFAVIFFILGLYLINFKKRRFLLTVLFIFLFLSIPIVLMKLITIPVNRIGTAVHDLENIQSVKNPEESTMQRIVVWKVTWDLAIDNLPFGVGTGDAKDVLINQYKNKKLTHILEKQFNAHNQYLQTFLALGIAGLLILISFIVIPFLFAIKKRDILLFLFIIIIALNMLVESMLERQAGCDFMALFISLLIFRITIPKKEIEA